MPRKTPQPAALSANPTPSHPGAPKGNRNALKHGFYSQQFKRKERLDLDRTSFQGLEDEIALLRVHIRRVMEQFAQPLSPSESIESLRALSIATLALCRLISTHNAHLLFEQKYSPDSTDNIILRVLDAMDEEERQNRLAAGPS